MKKLRVVKVVVQPTIVEDDGTELTEVQCPPVVVAAKDWPAYSSKTFPEEIAQWEERRAKEEAKGKEEKPAEESV